MKNIIKTFVAVLGFTMLLSFGGRGSTQHQFDSPEFLGMYGLVDTQIPIAEGVPTSIRISYVLRNQEIWFGENENPNVGGFMDWDLTSWITLGTGDGNAFSAVQLADRTWHEEFSPYDEVTDFTGDSGVLYVSLIEDHPYEILITDPTEIAYFTKGQPSLTFYLSYQSEEEGNTGAFTRGYEMNSGWTGTITYNYSK